MSCSQDGLCHLFDGTLFRIVSVTVDLARHTGTGTWHRTKAADQHPLIIPGCADQTAWRGGEVIIMMGRASFRLPESLIESPNMTRLRMQVGQPRGGGDLNSLGDVFIASATEEEVRVATMRRRTSFGILTSEGTRTRVRPHYSGLGLRVYLGFRVWRFEARFSPRAHFYLYSPADCLRAQI